MEDVKPLVEEFECAGKKWEEKRNQAKALIRSSQPKKTATKRGAPEADGSVTKQRK
jgi:hypothetical protein